MAPTRYHKISHDAAAIEALLVDLFLEAHKRPPKQIVLDLDATDDPLHGQQEGRFFHGYYDCYCYLPLYVFCGRHLLAAKLRRANIDAAAGAVEEVARIVAPDPRPLAARAHPAARRHRLCARGADGLVRGQPRRLPVRPRPQRAAGRRDRRASLPAAEAESRQHRPAGAPLQGLPAGRRSTAGAAGAASSPRPSGRKARPIRASSSPRSSAARLRAPAPLREASTAPAARWRTASRNASSTSSPIAPRPPPCAPTSCGCGSPRWPMCCSAPCAASASPTPTFAEATCGTIRLKLLKIGALVRITVRRIKIAMASACPAAQDWGRAARRLAEAAIARASPA